MIVSASFISKENLVMFFQKHMFKISIEKNTKIDGSRLRKHGLQKSKCFQRKQIHILEVIKHINTSPSSRLPTWRRWTGWPPFWLSSWQLRPPGKIKSHVIYIYISFWHYYILILVMIVFSFIGDFICVVNIHVKLKFTRTHKSCIIVSIKWNELQNMFS